MFFVYTLQDAGLYIMDNRPNLTGARICAIYLQYKMCVDPNLKNWTVNIPEMKNNAIKPNLVSNFLS